MTSAQFGWSVGRTSSRCRVGTISRVRGAQLCPSRFSIVGAFFGLTGVASPFRLRDTHSLVTTLAPGYSRSSLSRVASSTLSVTTTCVGDPTTSFAPRLRLDAALAPFCFCCPKPSERPPPPATTFSSICHGALWKNPLFAKMKPSKGRAFEGSIGVRGGRMALLVLRGAQVQSKELRIPSIVQRGKPVCSAHASSYPRPQPDTRATRRSRNEAHRRPRVHPPRGDRGRRAGGPVRRGAGALPGGLLPRQPGSAGE